MYEVWHYRTRTGKEVITEWLNQLRDKKAAAAIAVRLQRVAAGTLGDCKPLRDGVWEMRIELGPGYRVYYAMAGRVMVLLLCAGDKRTQAGDISRAVQYWQDYKRRTKNEKNQP